MTDAVLAATPTRRPKPLSADLYERTLAVGSVVLFACVVLAVVRGQDEWDRIPAIVWAHLASIMVVGLATVCEKRGDYSGAIAAYRRAVALRPDDAVMRSNLLYTLFYDPTISAESLRAEHAEWARRH